LFLASQPPLHNVTHPVFKHGLDGYEVQPASSDTAPQVEKVLMEAMQHLLNPVP
jgi:hypothetical protein